MALDQIKQERLKKLENIKKMGIDPYPARSTRSQMIAKAREMLDKEVEVVGRIRSLRSHGKITFADLEDISGKIQLFFSKEILKSDLAFKLLENLDLGDFIQVRGEVFKTQAGEISIRVIEFKLLTKTLLPLPSSWYGLKDTEERYRRRYLDLLLNPQLREYFVLKSKFWAIIRNFLINKGFLEVETPVLEAIPGGADARPFITHHNAHDIDLYLRISLELPLKRLVVGGYEKVFEIGRIFRNEGIDDEHLQDYTQMEFYWAYADYNELMKVIQELYQKVIYELFGSLRINWDGEEVDWGGDWPRVRYFDLLKDHWGTDAKNMSVEELYQLAERLEVKVEPGLGKGRLLDYIYKKTIRPKLIKPMFLIDPPVEVEPLAKRSDEDPELVERMQVLALGSELGKGFSELNDPLDQRERFEEQMKLRAAGDDEAQMMDEDFVEALEYGMPPTAGFGLSERLFAMLVDKPVREMVFFPTMKPEKTAQSTESGDQNIARGGQVNIDHLTDKVNRDDIGFSSGITREQAFDLVSNLLTNKNLVKHSLAVEAIMRDLADFMKKKYPNLPEEEFNREEWGLVGLLHDADYEITGRDLSKHTLVTAEKVRELGGSTRLIEAIKSHHDGIRASRDNFLERAIYAVDELSGLITATALVKPDKKLASVTVETVMKKFPEKSFAAGARRDMILTCESELGIKLEEFVDIALKSMKKIADDLGL